MRIISATVLLLLLAAPAWADADGQAWLTRIDEAARVTDAHLQLDVVVHDGRGGEAARTLEIWQKGDDNRLVRITEPARLAGVGLLVTHGDTIHLYLPQYPPARRVVSNRRADAFMGTDFAIEDLSNLTYADDFDATVSGTEDGLTILDLQPREGSGSQRIWVGEDAVVRRIDHMDKKGTVVRRLTMEDVRTVGSTQLAHGMTVEDLKRGRKTVGSVQQAEVDAGVSDEVFTVANLERD